MLVDAPHIILEIIIFITRKLRTVALVVWKPSNRRNVLHCKIRQSYGMKGTLDSLRPRNVMLDGVNLFAATCEEYRRRPAPKFEYFPVWANRVLQELNCRKRKPRKGITIQSVLSVKRPPPRHEAANQLEQIRLRPRSSPNCFNVINVCQSSLHSAATDHHS